ncbi:MAG: hypothetical protein A2Y80_09265 [Deltaproteobacteria bacterium RBG_13_58_19]|nr:MAG: hypothetical protein A2Y80_09265 [Deltaproteobacteria bacterium RBG_13_58_19]
MPRIDDYKASVALAVAALKERWPREVAARSQSEWFAEGDQEGLVVPYFGQPRRVTWPEVTVAPVDQAGELPLTEQILILHYLLNTGGDLPTGRTIDFRQVPSGSFYWSAFVSRAKTPLLQTFGNDLELYLEVARRLGGEVLDLGDASASFKAFPLVTVTHVLWRGDAEFPPEGNILFDETISQHLPTEDIAALAGASVYRLMGAARQMKK